MELQVALRARRSVRAYSKQPVSRDTIVALLEMAVLAPSSMNRQGWAFGLITDPARMASIEVMIKEQLLQQITPDSPMARYRETIESDEYSVLHGAPAAVVFFTRPGAGSTIDAHLAAMAFLLAAREQELGTCWIGFADGWLKSPAAQAELGYPDGYAPLGIVIVGHPQSWPEAKPREPLELVFEL